MDERGKPSFNLLQDYGSSRIPLIYYAFDVMVLAGKPVMAETLEMRRHLLEEKVLPKLDEPIRYSVALEANLADLIRSVKARGFEGLVAVMDHDLLLRNFHDPIWRGFSEPRDLCRGPWPRRLS